MKRKRMIPFANMKPGAQVVLRIRQDGNWFNLDITWPDNFETAKIGITENDLRLSNDKLRKAIQSIAITVAAGGAVGSNELKELISAGSLTFQKVFEDAAAFKAINAAVNTTSQSGVVIQVTTENFFLPWELLYPGDIPKKPKLDDLRSCWGLRHQIFRLPRTIRECKGRYQPPEIVIDAVPQLGLLQDDLLDSVRDKEVPFFQELDKTKKICLSILEVLDPKQPDASLRKVRKFLAGKLDVAHFACHAQHNAADPGLSILRLTHEFEASLDALDTPRLNIKAYPLVIFNACQTGEMNPLFTAQFARRFLEYGARGVLATDCEVPDDFAADFVAHLYGLLLAGKHLGESLLATRLHFFTTTANPAGLVYGMYASPNIHFRVKGANRGKKSSQ